MRVLHVGWGFSPWRGGGLIEYAEDLMAAQRERGHEVSYFFSGRHYPYLSGPRLKRWRRNGVRMHEVVNSPVISALEHGTRHPDRDVSEPRVEALFRRALREARPDVVHVQELNCLPSSLLELAAAEGVPTLMTLHDYGPLCTTLRLFDADGRLCMRRDVGADCLVRNADAPVDAGGYIDATMHYELARAARRVPRGGAVHWVLGRFVAPVRAHALNRRPPDPWERLDQRPEFERAYQRRRELNVERLSRLPALIAQSPRLAEIYRELGVADHRMRVMPAPARHIERIRPRRIDAPPAPVTFVTLNGCASPSKGSRTVGEAVRALRAAGLEGRFRLRVHGWVTAAARRELAGFEGVEVHGRYERADVDALLEEADVGLMPSMWEEAYGYTGLEMIAKGLPLIANPLGGIVQYAREGETAWLNPSLTGEGLAERMAMLVERPELVVEMHRRVLAARDGLIPSWTGHVDAIEGVYGELAGDAASAP